MPVNINPAGPVLIHRLDTALITGAVPLFLGAVLSDAAYASTYQVQWLNFSAWLIAGALVLTGLAVLWAVIGLLRRSERGGRALIPLLLLLATWSLGFINALVHARDAWATMPVGLVLSNVVCVTALMAAWTVLARPRLGATK